MVVISIILPVLIRSDCLLCSPDAIGSVSLHPIHPLAVTVSGSRHFDQPVTHTKPPTVFEVFSSSEDSDSDSDSSLNVGLITPRPYDASIRLWNFVGSTDRSLEHIAKPAQSLLNTSD